MRKYFMIGTVMAAMVLTVGCGNGKKEEATTAAATTVAETTVQETTVEETTTVAETTAVEEATTKVKKKTKKKADKGETAIMKKNKEETTEKVTETATEKVTKKVETTTKKAKKVVKKSSEKATKAKSNSNGKSTAKKYIGKNMDELVAQLKDDKNTDTGWIDNISLKEAISKLNDREKNIINLRFFKGKTQMEVSEEIGISQAQVSRLEKNALKTMRKYV